MKEEEIMLDGKYSFFIDRGTDVNRGKMESIEPVAPIKNKHRSSLNETTSNQKTSTKPTPNQRTKSLYSIGHRPFGAAAQEESFSSKSSVTKLPEDR